MKYSNNGENERSNSYRPSKEERRKLKKQRKQRQRARGRQFS